MKIAKVKKARETLQILKTDITVTPKDDLLTKINTSLKNKHKLFIVTPNPEILVKASRNRQYRDILNSADIKIPDGIGLTLAIKVVHGQSVKRIKGREFFLDLLKIADENEYSVYFLGAAEHVNKKAVKKASMQFKNASFYGSSDVNSQSEINKIEPHMLFVALGAPKQEIWIYENKRDLKVNVVMAVGGSLDFFVGEQVLAPKFISGSGLEWLWRGLFQPNRILRIFNAVVVFPLLVLLDNIRN